jgi:hypothetical protein
MAENNEKRLIESSIRRALEVQEIYLRFKQDDLPDIWIYRRHIKPRFHVSIRTFYRYLARNAKKELKELEAQNNNTHEGTTTD